MAEEYIVTIKSADIIRSNNNHRDPFCKVKYSHQEYKTKVSKNTATRPLWNEQFRFKKVKMDDELIIEIYDYESPIKNELVGIGNYNLKSLKFKKNNHVSHEIFLKNGKNDQKTGTVYFEIEYTREGIESEQEKEQKNLNGKEEIKEEEPPKPKKQIVKFELPPRKEKKKKKVRLVGDEFVRQVDEFQNFFVEKFGNKGLSEFMGEENIKEAIINGLREMGRIKPKNPIRFLGEYLLNYKN